MCMHLSQRFCPFLKFFREVVFCHASNSASITLIVSKCRQSSGWSHGKFSVTIKHDSSMRNWLTNSLWIISLMSKKMMSMFLTFRVWLMPSFPNVCLIINRVSVTLFPRFAQKCDAVPLLDPLQNYIRPDTRLQTKAVINQHVHSAAWDLHLASRCYNCCTDGSTSPGNYRYPLISFHQYSILCLQYNIHDYRQMNLWMLNINKIHHPVWVLLRHRSIQTDGIPKVTYVHWGFKML
jgi:hypothetical protein